jgi:tetratricopeptide (TPR) repeat protein
MWMATIMRPHRTFSLLATAALLGGLTLLAGCSGPEGQWEQEAGIREIKRGNFVRARSLLEKSIAQRPGSAENAEAFNQLGVACWNLGLQDEAVKAFEESIRIGPSASEPLYNLGVMLAGTDPVRAVGLLRDAAAADPADPRPMEYLGSMYAARRQWEEARRAYSTALERAPEAPRALTALALVELEDGGADKAVDALMQALARNSRYAPAVFDLALIYDTRLKDPLHAEPYFKRFLDLQTGTVDQVAYAKSALARIAAAEEPAPANAVATTQAVARAPEPEAPAPVSAEQAEFEKILRQAVETAQMGRAQQALEHFQKAAEAAVKAGRPDLREKALRTAKELCFDQPAAHYEMGRYLMERGRAAEALDAFQKASTLDPDFARGHLAAAEAAIAMDQMDTALIELRWAQKSAPDQPDMLWALANFYEERMNKPADAAKAYADFAAKFGRDPRAGQAAEKARKLGGGSALAARPPPPPEERRPQERKPEPPAPAPPPAVTTEVATARAPAPEPPAPRPPPATLPYKKRAVPNSKAAVQAFNQASLYQQQKNWDQALYYYLRAVENDDRMATAFYNIGVIYGVKGDHARAKEAYLKALELRNDMVGARYNLALTYRNTGDNPAAVKLLRQVLQAQPANAQAHYALGLIYSESPDTIGEAREHYQRFLDLAPNDVLAPAVRRWVKAH